MFTNRPALNKEVATPERKTQSIKSEQHEDFVMIRDAVQRELLENSNSDVSVNPEKLKVMIEEVFNQVLEDEHLLYNHETRNRLLKLVVADIVGYGPIEPLLENPDITEIMVNGPHRVYVEKFGLLKETDVQFENESHLMRVIDRIVSPIGRRVDEASPMVDARLPNGFRVNATIPPLSLDGATLTIRKFATRPFQVQDLISNNTLSISVANFLKACVEARINLVVSGGTGTGKTTFLNVLSSFIPEDERVITIEDTAELQLGKPHVVRLEKRPPNIEGKGEISIRQLVINALRMRPDRIVVGECRGGEAVDMLQAMNTGHDGSMTTIHANSTRDALRRIETMVMMAGMDLPLRAIREQVASSMELIVQLERMKDGTRKIVKVSEVQGLEGDTVVMQDIFVFEHAGLKNGMIQGSLKPTGLRPSFTTKLTSAGIILPEAVYEH
jgi:pilus assembly protein CpaF